jgi:hypothetical protein
VAGDEPVTAPDQHKPSVSGRRARIGVVVCALALVAMGAVGNHEGRIEEFYTYGFAGLLILIVIVDWMLRRSGLKSD